VVRVTLFACSLSVVLVACVGGTDPDEALAEGLAEQQAGNTEAAVDAYLDVLEIDPTDRFALYNLGLIAQQRGDIGSAETYYRSALDTDPTFVEALFNLAIIREDAGDPQEAIELYRQATQADPANARAHFNLGLLLKATGEGAAGDAELAVALDLDPSLSSRLEDGGSSTASSGSDEATGEG
jgi:tetratricopeptide (TPR) repeat protein